MRRFFLSTFLVRGLTRRPRSLSYSLLVTSKSIYSRIINTCHRVPWRFTSVARASQFINLRELQLDLSESKIDFPILSNLIHLERLAIRSSEVVTFRGCFPQLRFLEFHLQADPADLRKAVLSQLRVLRVHCVLATQRKYVLSRLVSALPVMPNLDTLLFSWPTTFSTSIDEIIATILEARPSLRLLDSSGATFWTLTGKREFRNLCDIVPALTKRFPSSASFDINAPGMFGHNNPPFTTSLSFPEMAACGWNPKNRYQMEVLHPLAYLVSHPERSVGALMKSVGIHSPGFKFLCKAWADVPVQDLITTEPAHPVLWAVGAKHDEMIQSLCGERRSQWGWFDLIDSPTIPWMHNTPIAVACLVCVGGQFLESLDFLFNALGKDALDQLTTLLASPHATCGTWLHFLAAHVPEGRLTPLATHFPLLQTQVNEVDKNGLKPVHHALANSPFLFLPSGLLAIRPKDYLAAIADADGHLKYGIRHMQNLLNREAKCNSDELVDDFVRQVLAELKMNGHSVEAWLRSNIHLIAPAQIEIFCAKLSRADLEEFARSFFASVPRVSSAARIFQLLLILRSFGCEWIGSQQFFDELYSKWRPVDIRSIIFSMMHPTITLKISVQVPLENILATSSGVDICEAVLDRLTKFGPASHQENLAAFTAIYGAKRALLHRDLYALRLLDYLAQSTESFKHASFRELISALSVAISLSPGNTTTLRTLLSSLRDRFGSEITVSPPAECPWSELFELAHRASSSWIAISELLVEFNVTSPSLEIPLRVGRLPARVLLAYFQLHPTRVYVFAFVARFSSPRPPYAHI